MATTTWLAYCRDTCMQPVCLSASAMCMPGRRLCMWQPQLSDASVFCRLAWWTCCTGRACVSQLPARARWGWAPLSICRAMMPPSCGAWPSICTSSGQGPSRYCPCHSGHGLLCHNTSTFTDLTHSCVFYKASAAGDTTLLDFETSEPGQSPLKPIMV